jgi:hypothetical protein
MFDLSNMQETFSFFLRLFLAIVAGIIGWFASAPLVSMLSRVAFHRKPHPWAAFTSRAICAGILAVLAFLFLSFGLGGGGYGIGLPGDETGKGTPTDSSNTKGKQKQDNTNTTQPNDKKDDKTLLIEVVPRNTYENNKEYKQNKRFFLIHGEKPVSHRELEAYLALEENERKWQVMDIRRWQDSLSLTQKEYSDLVRLAPQFGMTVKEDPTYLSKNKSESGSEGN